MTELISNELYKLEIKEMNVDRAKKYLENKDIHPMHRYAIKEYINDMESIIRSARRNENYLREVRPEIF
jgi:hypothetical protein